MTPKVEADDAAAGLFERVGDIRPDRARLAGTVKQQHRRVIIRSDNVGFEADSREALIMNDAHAVKISFVRCRGGDRSGMIIFAC